MGMKEDLQRLVRELETSQWRPRSEHRAWQFHLGSRLLRYAVEQVPFYAALRDALPAGDADLTPEQWHALPLLKRSDIQRHADALLARDIQAPHLPLGELVTSGSTGSPLKVRTTAVTRLFWDAVTLRDHAWHRRDLKSRLAAIRFFQEGRATYPQGEIGDSWGPPANLLYDTGDCALLNIQTAIPDQLEWLQRQHPAYLITYPSIATELGALLAERGTHLPGLRELRLFGEVADVELRTACQERFGVPVSDIYSANEVGYLALQCPEQGRYHEQAESILLELLDDNGAPCRPGQVGRVVVTALWNFAMPLIRYQIGDYAEAAGPCPCGRGLPALGRILGRTRNLLTLPSGERRWPSFGIAGIRKVAPVVQCQIVQHTPERLEARLVVERPLSAGEEERVRSQMNKRIGFPFQIELSYHELIGRSPAGKFEEFKSLLS